MFLYDYQMGNHLGYCCCFFLLQICRFYFFPDRLRMNLSCINPLKKRKETLHGSLFSILFIVDIRGSSMSKGSTQVSAERKEKKLLPSRKQDKRRKRKTHNHSALSLLNV